MDIAFAIGFIALLAMASSAVGAGLMFLAVQRIEGVKQAFGKTPQVEAERRIADIHQAARAAMVTVAQQNMRPDHWPDGEWRAR